MLDKLMSKIFPCEQVLRDLRADHANAARCNETAHEGLKRACINASYPQFAHVQGKNVNPR